MLNRSITAKNAPIIVIKSKFFINITSRKLPAKQVLHFCETAPNTSPPTSAMSTGACMLPGPFSLTAIRLVVTLKISMRTRRTGRTYPLALRDSYDLPRLKPLLSAAVPVKTPPTKPARAT